MLLITLKSWNGCLNEYRRQLVVQLLEFIRLKIMKRLIRRKEKVESWDSKLPSRIQQKISKIAKASRKLLVVKSNTYEYEILEYELETKRHYVVNLRRHYYDY